MVQGSDSIGLAILKRIRSAILWALWVLVVVFPLAGIEVKEVQRVREAKPDGTIVTRSIYEVKLRSSAFVIAGVVFGCLLLWAAARPLGEKLGKAARRRRAQRAMADTRSNWLAIVWHGFLFCLLVALISMPYWDSIAPLLKGEPTHPAVPRAELLKKYLEEAMMVFLYIVLALGLNITVGWAGQLVLGYAAFFGIGAYTHAILAPRWGVPFWLSLLLGGLVAALAGLLLGVPSLRLRGDYLAIVTLGFGETIRYLMKNLAHITGGEKGLPNSEIPATFTDPSLFGLSKVRHYYYLALLLVLVVVFILRRLNNSRIGRAWVAIREDEVAAQTMGINIFRMKLLAFALSTFFAGITGVLFARWWGYLSPEMFRFECSVLMVAMVIFGGMGSIPGVILGATILWLLPWLLRDPLPKLLATYVPSVAEGIQIEDYRLAIFGGILVLMMIFRPQGLVPSRRASFELGLEEGGKVSLSES